MTVSVSGAVRLSGNREGKMVRGTAVKLGVLLGIVIFIGVSVSAYDNTETFKYQGSSETWTVPDGVEEAFIEVEGPGGGGGYETAGGDGGYVEGTVDVSGRDALDIYVAGGGEQYDEEDGGWGRVDGEDGASWSGAGGGMSAVVYDGTGLLKAGGGAGGSDSLGDDEGGDGADSEVGGSAVAEDDGEPGTGAAAGEVSDVDITSGGGASGGVEEEDGEDSEIRIHYDEGGTGGGDTVWEVIDDFERGDLDPYAGDDAPFDIVSSPVYDGSYALRATDDSDGISSFDGDGLDRYIEKGDTFRYRFRSTVNGGEEDEASVTLAYGIDEDSNVIPEDGQSYVIWPDMEYGSIIVMEHHDSGGSSFIYTDPFLEGYEAGEWWTIEMEWQENDTHVVTVYDDDMNELGSDSGTPDDYFGDGGSIGWSSEMDDGEAAYADMAEKEVDVNLCAGGDASESFVISSREEWNQGDHDGTSVDRKEHSGTLGLGYPDDPFGDGSIAGYWRMDGTSGDVQDYSGNDNHGSNNGADRGLTGVFGTDAFSFDPDNDAFVSIGDPVPPELDMAGETEFTVSAWVKWDGTGDSTNRPIFAVGDGWSDNIYYLNINSNDNLLFGYDAEGGSNSDVWEGAYTSDLSDLNQQWAHVVGTTDASDVYLYINGVEADSRSVDVSAPDDNGGSADIGQTAGGGEYWRGELDEVKVFDRHLSQAEIQELYLNAHNDDEFEGEFTADAMGGDDTYTWEEISVNVESAGVSATFYALDGDENVQGSQDLGVLDAGRNTYDLAVVDSEKAGVVFEGDTTDPEDTWEVTDFTIYTEGGDGIPDSGDWVIDEDCLIRDHVTAPENVVVENNALVTIEGDGSLGLDFSEFYLFIREEAGIFVDYGTRIVQRVKASLMMATNSATGIGEEQATLQGEVVEMEDTDNVDVWFEYGVGSFDLTTGAETLSSPDTFQDTVTGLDDGTDYQYRAVGEAEDGTTEYGDMRTFTTESSAMFIDTFEDGDIDEYCGETGDFTVQSDVYKDHGYALLAHDTGSVNNIVSHEGDGLDHYIDQGDTFEFWFRANVEDGDSTAARPSIVYGVPTDGCDMVADGGYHATAYVDQGRFRLVRRPDTEIILSIDMDTYNAREWWRAVIEWQNDGTHVIELYDENGNFVDDGSVVDSTHDGNDGSVGWLHYTESGGEAHMDMAKIVED